MPAGIQRFAALLLACVTLAGLGTWQGCATRRGVEPKPTDTWVYVATVPGTLFIFDASADTIVDSVEAQTSVLGLTADPEEARFATIRGGDFRLYAADQQEPLITAAIPSIAIAFGTGGTLIGSGGGQGCVGNVGTRIYRLPEMTVESMDTLGMKRLRADHAHGLVYGIYDTCDVSRSWLHSDLAAYDYRNRWFFKRWRIDPDSNGVANYIVRYAIHPDGRQAYVITSDSRGPLLICYDLTEERIVFEREILSVYGWPEVTPDGQEVWCPQPGYGA